MGRNARCNVVLEDPRVSSTHCYFLREGKKDRRGGVRKGKEMGRREGEKRKPVRKFSSLYLEKTNQTKQIEPNLIDGNVYLKDTSRNGVFVNSRKVGKDQV